MTPERRIKKLEQAARHLSKSEIQTRLDKHIRVMTLPELQAIGALVERYMRTGENAQEVAALLERFTAE